MDLSTRQGRREQGQRIQQAVERAGISIEELAGRIGCSRALIYQYLSGSTLAQPDRLQQIAVQCGVPLTYFYSETPDEALSDVSQSSGTSVPATGDSTPDPETTAATPNSSLLPTLTLMPQDVTSRLNEGLRSLQELSTAQESPPDYRALASTCERILSLAAQIGDRSAQARAELDLGKALNNIGDFPRAAEALNRSVALSVEIGNIGHEMSARQNLGRALSMMGRTEEAREQFQRVAESPNFDSRWRGLLSLGSLHDQQGEYEQAMQQFEEAALLLEEAEANRRADRQEIAVGLLYVNTNRRNVYLAGGDLAEARRLAETCLADAEALGNADQNLAARLDMGWCNLYMGKWAQAHTGLTAMLQLARFVGDERREAMARATLGMLFAAAGDFGLAISYGKDALAQALSNAVRPAELYAQLALADAYTGQAERLQEARYHANQALAVTSAARYFRWEIECLLRLCRIHSLSQENQDLLMGAERAAQLARNLGARHLESLAHAWIAEGLRRSLETRMKAENGQANAETEDIAAQIRQEAKLALDLAAATDFVETRWRAQSVLGLLARLENKMSEAENHLRAAVTVLEELRAELLSAGLTDTLLENEDCRSIYAHLARLLQEAGQATDAEAFLEQTGWPPLDAQVGARIDSVLPAGGE